MSGATATKETLPATGFQAAYVLHAQDNNDGQPAPGIVPADYRTSLAVSPAEEPVWPQQEVYWRAGNTAGSSGLAAADTADIGNVVPTWVGYVSTTSNSGQAHLKVKPLANWGAPPSGANYYVDTGGNWENLTGSGAPAGGSGAEYDITMTGNLVHTHSGPTATGGGYDGARVVVMAAGGLSTNQSNTVPSGPLGGPGSKYIEVTMTATGGTGTVTATAMIRQYSPLLGAWSDTTPQPVPAAGVGLTTAVTWRIRANGYWFFPRLTAYSDTGTGGSLKIVASVQ